jgi:hypothetical protein
MVDKRIRNTPLRSKCEFRDIQNLKARLTFFFWVQAAAHLERVSLPYQQVSRLPTFLLLRRQSEEGTAWMGDFDVSAAGTSNFQALYLRSRVMMGHIDLYLWISDFESSYSQDDSSEFYSIKTGELHRKLLCLYCTFPATRHASHPSARLFEEDPYLEFGSAIQPSRWVWVNGLELVRVSSLSPMATLSLMISVTGRC